MGRGRGLVLRGRGAEGRRGRRFSLRLGVKGGQSKRLIVMRSEFRFASGEGKDGDEILKGGLRVRSSSS